LEKQEKTMREPLPEVRARMVKWKNDAQMMVGTMADFHERTLNASFKVVSEETFLTLRFRDCSFEVDPGPVEALTIQFPGGVMVCRVASVRSAVPIK
jgi:hypothetical protein